MTRVKIIEKTETPAEVEVEFPVFSRHDIDGDGWSTVIYARLDADGTRLSVKIDGGGDIELETQTCTLRSPLREPDYILGRGEYKSSAREFYSAVDRAMRKLKEFDAHRAADKGTATCTHPTGATWDDGKGGWMCSDCGYCEEQSAESGTACEHDLQHPHTTVFVTGDDFQQAECVVCGGKWVNDLRTPEREPAMNARATYLHRSTIINNRPVIETVLNVESDQGWLGGCVLHSFTKAQGYEMAYNEANRRASAQGFTLQTFRPE